MRMRTADNNKKNTTKTDTEIIHECANNISEKNYPNNDPRSQRELGLPVDTHVSFANKSYHGFGSHLDG